MHILQIQEKNFTVLLLYRFIELPIYIEQTNKPIFKKRFPMDIHKRLVKEETVIDRTMGGLFSLLSMTGNGGTGGAFMV